MASISTPFPLSSNTSQSASARTYTSAVRNSSNEVAVAVDCEGVSVHNISPNRVVSAYSTGLDVEFLCAPVSIRRDIDTTVTWSLYEEKGDVKLLWWTQRGVDSNHTILYAEKSSGMSLLAIDDTGDAILVCHSNTRLECYKIGEAKAVWSWDVNVKPTHLRTFNASECPFTQKFEGYVLLVVAEQAKFYSISSAARPTEAILSIKLAETPTAITTLFDIKSASFFQLFRRSLNIVKPNNTVTTFNLMERYDHFHPLSSSHVLLASRKTLIIYDIVYGTAQAELELSNSLKAVITTPNPLSFHAIVKSENKSLVIPITIPETATLLDAIDKERTIEVSTKDPLILLTPKVKVKQKKVTSAVKALFKSLKSASEAHDAKKFDKEFKDFRKKYRVNREDDNYKRTKLTPEFVKELMSLIFTEESEGLSLRIYPEDTLKYLLEVDAFSRDLLPGGQGGLVCAALGSKKFLRRLLEKQPTPFTYRDYLLLIKYILDRSGAKTVIPPSTILESFERDIDKFFDKPDMRTVLSNNHLEQFLQLLTKDPQTISYPTLLCAVLDSIGLGPLLLTQSLSTDAIDHLCTTLDTENASLETCLETSSLLTLLLHRQKDPPFSHHKGSAVLFGDRKRKLGQFETVAQEGGMMKRRSAWIKKPRLPKPREEITRRFVAQTKVQDVPAYSLDRIIL